MARGFARRRAKKIDNVRWANFSNVFAAMPASTVGFTAFTAGVSPETWMRLRGSLLCYDDGLSGPGPLAQISAGLILVPEGTGTTVTWSPFTDAEAPWIWWTSFFIGYEEMVTDVIDVPGITSYREIIDNKSMRRIRPDQEVQLVAENTTQLAAESVNLCIQGRVLLGS